MKTNTKPAHTPGPWKILKESDRQGFKGIGIKGSNDCVVANLIFQIDDSEQANARLIAAAPELLEALKKNHAGYASQHGFNYPGSKPNDCKTCALIAKAEGR